MDLIADILLILLQLTVLAIIGYILFLTGKFFGFIKEELNIDDSSQEKPDLLSNILSDASSDKTLGYKTDLKFTPDTDPTPAQIESGYQDHS